MKTTIEISDLLLQQAKRLAAQQNITLRELVELGLRRVISEKREAKTFTPRKASFKGNGLQPGLKTVSWDRLRELAYEGRGT